jgi:hypothetical protein
MLRAAAASLVAVACLAGCGQSAEDAKKARCAAVEKSAYDAIGIDTGGKPIPGRSKATPEQVRIMVRIIVNNQSCFDPQLVAHAQESLSRPTPTPFVFRT